MAEQELTDEQLGQEVRRIWIEWANEQSSPKPSWLLPWGALSEPDKDVDRRIGRHLYAMGVAQQTAADKAAIAELKRKLDNAQVEHQEAALLHRIGVGAGAGERRGDMTDKAMSAEELAQAMESNFSERPSHHNEYEWAAVCVVREAKAVSLIESRDKALHAELQARVDALEIAIARWARDSAALGPLSRPDVALIEAVGALRELKGGG